MKAFLAGLAIFGVLGAAGTPRTIREVDFKNFSYAIPVTGPTLGHDRLVWLSPYTVRHVKLVNGKSTTGFSFQSEQFGDVLGNHREEAVVVLRFDTGGVQNTNYVYIYSFVAERPKLLAYFHTGDRAFSGLYRVYGENGLLVVDLFDPDRRSGDCCSSGYVRTGYRWLGGRFQPFGPRENGTVEHP